MVIEVRVIANSKVEKVEEIEPGKYKVHVKPPAIEGKANAAVLELLSTHFKIKKSQVKILKGETNKNKIINIGD